MGMFLDMSDMIGNYEERLIGNDKVNGFEVDTVRVTDTGYYAETAIRHPELDDGYWIIVQEYETHEQAEKGHERWVDMLENEKINTIICVQTGRTYHIRW